MCFWSWGRQSRGACWPIAGGGARLPGDFFLARAKGVGGPGTGTMPSSRGANFRRPSARSRRSERAVRGEGELLTIQGTALAALEELGPAPQTLERAWRVHPSCDAARVLAAIYLSANENECGLQMLIEASRLDPADFRPWYAMGESVYLRLHRHDLAVEAFRESLKRRPSHTESRIGLVDVLVRSHRALEAAPLLEQVLQERPDNPRVLALAAELALESGDEERAARHLELALKIDPDYRQALILHSRLLFRQGRRQEALPEAEHACTLEPNDIAILTLLSSIQSSLGLGEEARQTLAHKRDVQQRAEMMAKLAQEIMDNPQAPEPRCAWASLPPRQT